MRVATDIGEISTAVPSVDNGLPGNDVPAKTVPELAGEVIRRVMRRLEADPSRDPIELLARELEEIESKPEAV